MKAESPIKLRELITAAAVLTALYTVFVIFLNFLGILHGAGIEVISFGSLFIIAILMLLFKCGFISDFKMLAIVSFTALTTISVRTLALEFASHDYEVFLSEWMEFYRDNGGILALGKKIGDYNFPYLYFLSVASYFPVQDLYLIKFISMIFDILLAFSSMKLVSLCTNDRRYQFGIFLAVLLLPTVAVNSALWGQCDSIYTSFGLLGLYYGLKRRAVLSVALAAIAFSFKLQIIFLLPIYAVLLFAGRIKFRHLFVFPFVYLLTVLPAVVMGRPITDAVTIYTNQVGIYSSLLTLNAPSVYAFFTSRDSTSFRSMAGIIAAFSVLLLILSYALARRKRLSDRSILLIAALMVIFIPFLLPSMHDRYFFLADILTVICAFVFPQLLPVSIFAQLASWSGYQAYLFGGGIGIRIGAVLLLAAGLILAGQLLYTLEVKSLKNDADIPETTT